jgi:hypothetical protein
MVLGVDMFVQVINGKVTDAAAVKALGERWYAELAPGATGWLGSTAGVTADSELVLLARFESAEAAQRNSDRPEQGEWWSEAKQCFTDEPTFYNFDDAIEVGGGGSDDAGFVQVMFGKTSDPARERELTKEFDPVGTGFRRDILGGIACIADDGTFTQAFYFTSESEARVGEKQEIPEELRESFEESMSMTSDLRYLDLTDPWLYSPR